MNYKSVCQYIVSYLLPEYDDVEANGLAWWILEELSGMSRASLMMRSELEIDTSLLDNILNRLLHHEPVQYIFGHTLWCGLDLKVSPAVLIPRPETAEIIEIVKQRKVMVDNMNFLDIGTGSGCIAIALKKCFPCADITGLDVSNSALHIAHINAVNNAADINLVQCDILDVANYPKSVMRQYDVIVSNPPYITSSESACMDKNVLDYEPHTALFVSDADPLVFYRTIGYFASVYLKPTGLLVLEINQRFGQQMLELMQSFFQSAQIELRHDNYGNDRFVVIQKQL